MLLEEYLLGDSPHHMFESNYGMAKSLRGPNECGQFWYRWFPGDRHFIAYHEYSKEELLDIRRTICAISIKFLKPLVFKNLNNGQRLQMIKKILPESLIIFVKRDPVFTAQSILGGRLDFYGDKNTWFSVMPKNKVGSRSGESGNHRYYRFGAAGRGKTVNGGRGGSLFS